MTEPRDPETRTDPVDPDLNPWRPVDREGDEPSPGGVSYDPADSIVRAEEAPGAAEPHEEPAEPAAEEEPVEPTQPEVADDRPGEPEPSVADEPAAEPVEPEVAEDRPGEPEVADDRPGEPEPPVEDEPAEVADDRTVVPAAAERRDEPDDNTEPTHVITRPEAEGTERLEVPAPVAVPTPPADAIFRPPSPVSPTSEPTRVEPLSEEEQRLADERAARREAREAAFAAPPSEPAPEPRTVVVHKRTNDKFWGALGLFLLRLVLVGIFTIRGLNLLTDLPAAEAQFGQTVLADYPPGALMWALITGVACVLIALSLLLGLLTRVAGLGIALIAGGALAFVYWGPWSPIVPGRPGFWGEYELLLAAVGVLLMCIGAGGWSLDRSFRAGRERNKRERAAEGV